MILSGTFEYVLLLALIGALAGWFLYRFLKDDKYKHDYSASKYRESDELIDWFFKINKLSDFKVQREEMAAWKEAAIRNYEIRHRQSSSTLPANVTSVLEHRARTRGQS